MIAKFEIYNDDEFWCARGIREDIFTQGKTLDELILNLKEAVELHFEEEIELGEEINIISISEFEIGSIAKGTLNDIISKISLWNGLTKDEVIERLR
jgi:predicted RNase H-like HicB family nuclease